MGLRGMIKNSLSVCILIYKSIDYIDRCIRSLLCQTDMNFEIVLVDNASPDHSVDRAISLIEEKQFNNWKVIRIEESTGCGQGRTKGYMGASGTYIKYLDSDDTLPPYYVAEINHVIMHKSPDIIMYGHRVVDTNDKVIRSIGPCKDTCIAKCTLAMFWRYTFKRELAVKAQVDTSGLHYGEDRLFSLKLIPYIKHVEIINKFMYNYTKNQASTTNCKDQRVYEKGRACVFEEYRSLYLSENSNDMKRGLLYAITKFYISTLAMNCKELPQQQKEYFRIYHEKYLQCLGLPKYKYFIVIPKGNLSLESLVIQIAYLLLKFKLTFVFRFIFTYLY